MDTPKKYIDFSDLEEMLYGDEVYIKDFAQAAIQSFTEFSENYRTYLLAEDETNFRKAGHKIKPVAKMLHIEEIVNEYEHAKTLLHQDENQEKLEQSSRKMTQIVDHILQELNELA